MPRLAVFRIRRHTLQRITMFRAAEKFLRPRIFVVLDLPSVPSVNGPDDFLGLCGDEAMALVFEHPQGQSKHSSPGDWPDPASLGDELPATILRGKPPLFRAHTLGQGFLVHDDLLVPESSGRRNRP